MMWRSTSPFPGGFRCTIRPDALNIMGLHAAVLSAVIFNAIIIVLLIPLALRGVKYRPLTAAEALRNNLLIYGLGGSDRPFIGIKLIDIVLAAGGGHVIDSSARKGGES